MTPREKLAAFLAALTFLALTVPPLALLAITEQLR